ncbi:MAG: DUF1297 domain-containing protein [Methanobacteriota archaeon]|nr:MAG: DUF1297 domain-containing protein [Euryarchaeota archaeon]
MPSDVRIATIASHSALQILKGAKDEGFETIAICRKGNEKPYRQFKVADKIISVDSLEEFEGLEQELIDLNAVLVPHGSFIAYMGVERVKKLRVPYFGHKAILDWESDRQMEREWLQKAGLRMPITFESPDKIDRPVIVKFFGAGGGKGYFFAKSEEEFHRKYDNQASQVGDTRFVIQEYIMGNPLYIHYFHSILNDETELMSFDRRYETNVDALGRIPSSDQMEMRISPSYLVMGNIPLVVRESYLPRILEMGEKVVEASREITSRGLYGPFCLETIVTDEGEIVTFEISARIVAGTNPYINGSPYTWLRYDVPMSTGRRIALEIREALEQGRFEEVVE